MTQFHPLRVTDIRRVTRDAVAVTLEPPADQREAFAFKAGQYLTLRKSFDGEEVRRSYSICASPREGRLRVGIKKVADGLFSNWANEDMAVGDTIEAMPPMGQFHLKLDPKGRRYFLGFAGGSGITPVLSIIKTVLEEEPGSSFTLLYANQSSNAIMFREEIEDLKNIYLGRFSVLHFLEREPQEIELFNGRIDGEKLTALFKSWIDIAAVDTAFICGPEPMMKAIAAALQEHGLKKEQIKFELFAAAQAGRRERRADAVTAVLPHGCEAQIVLEGTTRVVQVAMRDQTVLEAALAAGLDAPHACRAGVCSTCKAKIVSGEVEMDANHALEDYEVRAGYVLTCQSYPLTSKLVVDYDQGH